MPEFPSRGEQRKEPNSILIRGLSASPVFSLRTFSTFSTESPEAQCPWNGFEEQMRLNQFDYLHASEHAQASLAEQYVGLPFDA